jgi:hypothetical protein
MKLRMQRVGAGLLAVAAGLGGVAVVSTAAMATPTSVSAHAIQDSTVIKNLSLWNLSKRSIVVPPILDNKRDVLVLINGAKEVPGGKYFLVNPATGTISGVFILWGGLVATTVDTAQQVRFIPPKAGTLQVRYGDPKNIANAAIIASATAQTYQVTNMEFGKQPSMGGGQITVLKVAQDPMVTGPGMFYTFDPATQRRTGGFVMGGDMMLVTVSQWEQAQIFPPNGTIEIRFGNPDDPTTGPVVASATKL